MSIDKPRKTTHFRGFFMLKSLYQNYKDYIPLLVSVYQKWYLYTKSGTYKPLGLLQDTHFVCTNCKSC